MTALQLRKRTLLLESDLNRLALHAEWAHLCGGAGCLGRLKDAQHKVTPWLMVLVPLAGVAFGLGLRRRSSGGSLLAKVLAIAPSLIHVWRACAATAKGSK